MSFADGAGSGSGEGEGESEGVYVHPPSYVEDSSRLAAVMAGATPFVKSRSVQDGATPFVKW